MAKFAVSNHVLHQRRPGLKTPELLLCAREAFTNIKAPDVWEAVCARAVQANPWFTFDEIERARLGWLHALREEAVVKWTEPVTVAQTPRRVGLVLAGNIPWVGLHDVLATLLSGHIAVVKCSRDDTELMVYLLNALQSSGLTGAGQLEVVDRLNALDAVIATGSNNSNRYFLHYFGHIPHLFRKSRTSVALIGRQTSGAELKQLSTDLFAYFGMGCRNVRHLLLEEGVPIDSLLEWWREDAARCMLHHRYANNFDYQQALHLMNRMPHHAVPGLILRRDEALFSALSVVTWQYVPDAAAAVDKLMALGDQWQCAVCSPDLWPAGILYGQSQSPELWDYADGVNTLEFLRSIGN